VVVLLESSRAGQKDAYAGQVEVFVVYGIPTIVWYACFGPVLVNWSSPRYYDSITANSSLREKVWAERFTLYLRGFERSFNCFPSERRSLCPTGLDLTAHESQVGMNRFVASIPQQHKRLTSSRPTMMSCL
jgi:hypothetical protein